MKPPVTTAAMSEVDGTSGKRLADDLLDGAAAIADETGYPTRRIYYLAARGLLPVFWIGNRLCSTRSALRRHFARLVQGAGKDT